MSKARKIVLIMTDTQSTGMVGCYGNPDMKTPSIDRLAAEGVRFDRAYTVSPVCGPARSGLFTGTFPHTNGSWGNDMAIGLNIKTVGQRLADAGMHTAYIGKWHLDGTDYFGNGICPDGWDPDYWYDMRRYLEEHPDDVRALSRNLDNPDSIREHGIEAEFTYAHRCSNRAIDFLEKYSDDDFLLVVSYDEPHGPSTCPAPFCDMYRDYEYPLPENAFDTLEDKPEHIREWAACGKRPQGKTINRAMLFACNAFVDHEIGRVVDAIDSHAPDALVIYTADHGTPLFSHGLNSKGPAMFQETTNVPFVVRWPGQAPAGAANASPVSHIDVVPTMLDAAGLEKVDFLEGHSMLHVFQDPSRQANDTVFIEFNRYEIDHDGWGGFQPIRCAFDGRYKLVVNLHYTDELYDLQEDPGEMRNLIESPEHAAVRDALHDRIIDWMNRTRDPFRGIVWDRRPWKKDRRLRWNGSTRPRPDDGYEPRMLLYETGLPIEKYEYKKN